MADIKGYNFPDELFYHKEHMWVKKEGDNKVRVGLDDFSQKLAGELSFIELPDTDNEVSQDEVIGSFETGKWMGKVFAPLTGTVIEVNEELEDEPALINEDPYGKGWIFVMEVDDPSSIEKLMHGDAIVGWIEEEIKKHGE